MRRTFAAAALALLSILAGSSVATTPPPAATFEEEVCAATHVFIAKTKKVRFVTAKVPPICKGEPAVSGDFLTLCGRAEVDLEIEQVLYPVAWAAPGKVQYQFGGGYFATKSLRADLEGQRYLLHAVVVGQKVVGQNSTVTLGPSYPWVLGKRPEEAGRAAKVLASCKPDLMSEQSLGPARFGKPLLAAQLQR